MIRNACAYNNKFWDFVKKLVKENNSTCKPCKYFEAHKKKVLEQYNKTKYINNNNSNEKNHYN